MFYKITFGQIEVEFSVIAHEYVEKCTGLEIFKLVPRLRNSEIEKKFGLYISRFQNS